MDLPAEIRNSIYELALVPESEIMIKVPKRYSELELAFMSASEYRSRVSAYSSDTESAFSQPPLARVSKQIRKETLPIFYGGNSFVVGCALDSPDGSVITSALSCIGLFNRKLLRTVWIPAWITRGEDSPGLAVGMDVEEHLADNGIMAKAGDFVPIMPISSHYGHIRLHFEDPTVAPAQRTSFMDLPAEMRNRIYELVLVRDRDFIFDNYQRGDEYVKALQQPPLTRVNNAIRSESLPVFYGFNTIKVLTDNTSYKTALRWLQRIGGSNRKLLLQFWCYGYGFADDDWSSLINIEDNFKKEGIVAKESGSMPVAKGCTIAYIRFTFGDSVAET